jgi:DNA-binding NarL/FixJ family response regulator
VVAVYNRQGTDSLGIYVAEDSPIMSSLLQTLLSGEPTLRVIGQGRTAEDTLRDIETLRPDVVIVDLVLERSSGFEVLESLSVRPRSERPLIVVLTNHTGDNFREDAMRLGADFFFDKCGEIIGMLTTLTEVAREKFRRNGSDD